MMEASKGAIQISEMEEVSSKGDISGGQKKAGCQGGQGMSATNAERSTQGLNEGEGVEIEVESQGDKSAGEVVDVTTSRKAPKVAVR